VRTASIVIPTRARAAYLEVALRSVMPQAGDIEVVVVCDGPDAQSAAVAARHGARVVTLAAPSGLNAARNAGVAATEGEMIVFLDDDVRVTEGWLEALLSGARRFPDHGVLGGPIRAELEGGPRACGREPAPITTLDLGPLDRDAEVVWGANMAIRRSVFAHVGGFDERLSGRGDEEEWERRFLAAGGRVGYIAGAAVVHRRDRADSRLIRLCRAAYALGRTARANDVRKGTAPATWYELRVLAGCGWHTLRRRCGYGIVMGAHAAGRLAELVSHRRGS